MLTITQALSANEFHADGCVRTTGPRGGVTESVQRYRRNGSTQTWKTRPTEFRVPVKYGMYGYGNITHSDAAYHHTSVDCPLNS